jgi:NAD(P)-dependent dehydrogenase (short-subunit alcohol dehydrogenase family)
MLLQDKVAVVYGAAGEIGGAVARAFAGEGARVFLTGRLQAPVEVVAKDIVSAGGHAEAAEVDALDEPAVDRHLLSVLDKAGRVDISFNAIGIPDARILGVPLAELDIETFSLPIAAYTRSYFLTAHLAAAHMIPKKSGVIMTVTALPARMGSRLNGGYGPAMAAKEALTRDLSASSHRTASGWSACGHTAYRRPARCGNSPRFAPRHRALPGNSSPGISPARPTRDGSWRSRKWPTWRSSWRPTERAG